MLFIVVFSIVQIMVLITFNLCVVSLAALCHWIERWDTKNNNNKNEMNQINIVYFSLF